ncbi:unnamed protein product [Clavelina lepadiformis]|uniref:G-protein coupled receptors family 1 profile domain-containing protein n=1 Tax=Clavelina lepadiformis TaxID=159417 RepID=A0ABP0FYN8_CLALP
MDWWGFRKTLMVGLFLIMNANVVCLIRGITKTAYIVGRGGVTSVTLQIRIRSSSVSSDPEKVTRKLLRGKGEAILIISLSWIIPLIYTLLIFGWNCRDYCTCLPAYYNKKHFCSTENEPLKCSNIWAPMRKGHLLLAVAIWAAQLIAIVLMLIFASRKYYRKAIKPTSPSKPPLEKDAENNDEITTLPRTQSTVSQKPYKPPLHPSMKLLIVLSTLYVLSTAPMMLCFLIDSVVTSRTYVSDLLVTISSAIVFVYCFVGPVFMIKYMPGLKSALVRMFLRCDCTVTTAVTNVARSVTMRARNRSNV